MEEHKRLVVKGFVQGVGYRAFVRLMAKRYGIKGKVRNLKNGDVEIIAIGDGKSLDMFIKSIKISAESPFEPDVHEILVKEYPDAEKFDNFYVDYGYDMTTPEKEMIERSEIGILAFGWMGKYLGNKIDNVSEKMDKGFAELGGKIDILSEKIDSGFSKTNEKLDEISSKLDRNTEKTTELQREMNEKFEYLDVKYGEFGNTLKKIEKDISEMKEGFLKLVDYITEKGNL